MVKSEGPNYKWYILFLSAITLMFAMSVAGTSLPVLFAEIAEELGLSLVQIGTVWSIIGVSGILVVMPGGLIGDRFGVKRTLSMLCFLGGLIGAARGLSHSFATFATTAFVFGIIQWMLPIVAFKPVNIWFTRRHLGLANTILTVSVALGGVLGAILSATVLSPLLGGWRNVLFLYGGITFILGILWVLSRSGPSQAGSPAGSPSTVPFRQAFSQVSRNRNTWLIGLIMLGHMGSATALRGYLPLYLRGIGWAAASADGVLATYTAASMIGAMPITLLSNRFGSRKALIFTTVMMTTIGVGLLSVVSGWMVWVAVAFAGLAWDGFMAMFFTITMETEGIGVEYTGTALGLSWTLGSLGNIIAPFIGYRIADVNPSFAFVFWAALAIVPLLCSISFVKETGWRADKGATKAISS